MLFVSRFDNLFAQLDHFLCQQCCYTLWLSTWNWIFPISGNCARKPYHARINELGTLNKLNLYCFCKAQLGQYQPIMSCLNRTLVWHGVQALSWGWLEYQYFHVTYQYNSLLKNFVGLDQQCFACIWYHRMTYCFLTPGSSPDCRVIHNLIQILSSTRNFKVGLVLWWESFVLSTVDKFCCFIAVKLQMICKHSRSK